MDCKACNEELKDKENQRWIDTGDQRCFSCIDKTTPPINTNKSTGSLPDKYTNPQKEEVVAEEPSTPEPKKEETVTAEPKETYGFPEPGDRNPPPPVSPTIYNKETSPRFKLNVHDTATGKWQIDVTIEGPDYQVIRSNTDSDVGELIKEPLAAIAMSMINEMEVRLKAQGKVLADAPKELKEEKAVKAVKPKKAVKK